MTPKQSLRARRNLVNEQTALNTEQVPGALAHTRFRQLLRQAIVVPILAGVVSASLLLWQIENLVTASKWVDHTDQVIGASFELQKLMLDAEVGVRGFYAGKREEFMESYNSALEKVPGQFQELRQLISSQEAQSERLRILETQWK